MAKFAQGKIEAFAGPIELGAQDNLETVIADFIGEAEKTLDIAVQELDNEVIAQAILDAAFRGVSIRMFTEQDYLKANRLPKVKSDAENTKREAELTAQCQEKRRSNQKTNRDILAALLRCGVDVKADLNPEIFHQKFIVRDFRYGRSQGKVGLLTGSTNFTRTGTHKNLNHVVVFHDRRIAKAYANEFNELMEGTFGELRSRKRQKLATININGVPVRIKFAPDDAPELEIVKQMLKCREQLDFAIFTFSGSSGIDDAMLMLRQANLKVRGVLDKGQGKQSWAATEWLHHSGIEVFLTDNDKMPGVGKLHHKLMVIDDAIVIAGSMNYTKPANDFNDENIFVIGSPFDLPDSKGGPVDHDECKAITNFFRTEIDRIITHSSIYAES